MGPSFGIRSDGHGGISELYSSVLMVGVTLALGGLVTSSALSQFALANDSASLGAAQDVPAMVQVGLVYFVAAPSGSCPAYKNYQEGSSVSIAFYNYGEVSFSPVDIVVNGSAHAGGYAPVAPGSMRTYELDIGTCSRSWGDTVTLIDQEGNELQFAT